MENPCRCGCGQPAPQGRQFIQWHHLRVLPPRVYRRIPLPERFWAHVVKTQRCWLWSGAIGDRGYGRIGAGGRGGRFLLAHRAAWELVAGPIPEGMDVLHTCDTPACVRNDEVGVYEVNGVLRPRRGHLFLGTRTDNSQDMVGKGRTRGGAQPGEGHPRARLTAQQVDEIRRARELGTSVTILAETYGVASRHIYDIVTRKTWKHV
jgi:hypothetical protein